MQVTMDGAGRVVIPKPARDQLGLEAGTEFDLLYDSEHLALYPRHPKVIAVTHADGRPVFVTTGPEPPMTVDDVRAVRDALDDERAHHIADEC
jgi:AbrB family looped-hinge helix DNA binding protein